MPLSILGSVLRGQTPSPSQATKPDDDANTSTLRDVMTTAHDAPIASPAPSRPASSGSDATDEKLKKRVPRSKTSYNIARPVQPINRSKLHLRPKVILQLHQVLASQRPKPAYEVIPFSLFPQRSTRHLTRTFNTRERLGPHDLLVVRAEAYNTKDKEGRSEEDRLGSREVIGVISPGKSEKGVTGPAEICLNDGFSRWEVSDMPNGGYEFNSTDEHGLTLKARWVLKPAYTRRVSTMLPAAPLSPTSAPGPEDKKFTFSTINSCSRRHPIIATMTRTRIDVMDTYAMPSATSPPTPGFPSYTHSPTTTPSTAELDSFLDTLTHKLPIETDDALKRFILVSGIWVASQNFCSSEPANYFGTPALASSATSRPPNHRAVTMSVVDLPRSVSPASTIDESRRSIPRMLRASVEKLPRQASFTDTPASPLSTRTTVNPSPVLTTRTRRAYSTGTHHLHSMTGSMRKHHGLAFEDQTLVESPEERQMKRSEEILRIRELTLASPIERPSMERTPSFPAAIPSSTGIPPSSDTATSPAPLLASPVLSPLLLSPPLPDSERARKTQSAYAPIKTAGMWDSGVAKGPGLKKRPTSMFVSSEKKRKQEKKSDRRKSRDGKKEEKQKLKDDHECFGFKRKGDWYKYKVKLHLKNMFRSGKT